MLRFLLFFIMLFFSSSFIYADLQSSLPQSSKSVAQKIVDHFSHVRSISGDFLQLAGNGQEIKGKFFIQRPGKLRFTYVSPANHEIIADGQSLVVLNKKLKTSDLYPLSKTPLKFLLDNTIDLSDERFQSVQEKEDAVVVEMLDKSSFGNTKIMMVFDRISFDLKQWTVKDSRNQETTIVVSNLQKNQKVDPSLFVIDYTQNRKFNEKKSYR